jgi:hypothetical protein
MTLRRGQENQLDSKKREKVLDFRVRNGCQKTQRMSENTFKGSDLLPPFLGRQLAAVDLQSSVGTKVYVKPTHTSQGVGSLKRGHAENRDTDTLSLSSG